MLQKFFAIVTSLIVLAPCIDGWGQQAAPAVVKEPTENRAEEKKRPEFPTIHVEDLHCKHCAKRLARKLFTVPGVKKVRANVKEDIAIVIPQKDKNLSPLALWEAAEVAKFKVVKIEMPKKTINKKPVELADTKRSAVKTGAPPR